MGVNKKKKNIHIILLIGETKNKISNANEKKTMTNNEWH